MNIVTDIVKLTTWEHSVKVSAYDGKQDGEMKFKVKIDRVGKIAVTRDTDSMLCRVDFTGSAFELEMLIEALQTAKDIYDREKWE